MKIRVADIRGASGSPSKHDRPKDDPITVGPDMYVVDGGHHVAKLREEGEEFVDARISFFPKPATKRQSLKRMAHRLGKKLSEVSNALAKRRKFKARLNRNKPSTARARQPARHDPTQTGNLRRALCMEIRRRYAILKGRLLKLVDEENAFGLTTNEAEGVTRRSLQIADFVRLPRGVQGTNCSNCRYSKGKLGDGVCHYHDGDVDLRGLEVTDRDCCGEWDAPGTKRPKNQAITNANSVHRDPSGDYVEDSWGWQYPVVNAKDALGHGSEKRGGGKLGRIADFAKGAPAKLLAKVRESARRRYGQLSDRYGPTYAKAIVASAIAGIALPLPGSSFIAAGPVLALAEMHRFVSHTTNAEVDDAAVKWLLRKLHKDFGLKYIVNAFCPTGEGGGVDPTCSPITKTNALRTFHSIGKVVFGSHYPETPDVVKRIIGEPDILHVRYPGEHLVETQLKNHLPFADGPLTVRIDFKKVGHDLSYSGKELEPGSLAMLKAVKLAVQKYHEAGFQIEAAPSDERREKVYFRILTQLGLSKQPGLHAVWNLIKPTENRHVGQRLVRIDLDGTILDESVEYPGYGVPRPGARETMLRWKREGWIVVVWTARENPLDETAKVLESHGIPFDGIERKPHSDRFVDDRGVDGRRPWDEIAAEVERTPVRNVEVNSFCPTGEGGGVDPSCLSHKVVRVKKELPDSAAAFIDAMPDETTDARLTEIGAALTDEHEKRIIERDGNLVGAVSFKTLRAGVGEIWQLGSVEKGVGKSLVQDLQRSYKRLIARTVRDEAVGFYQRMGFKRFSGNDWVWDRPVANVRFAFQSTSEQMRSFQQWLQQQLSELVISKQMDSLVESYAEQGMRKGFGRSFDDTKRLRREAYDRGDKPEDPATETMGDFYKGTREEFLRSSFSRPVVKEKVKVLASRTYMDLKNATHDFATKTGRILSDGLVQGRHPKQLAKDLAKEVDISRKRAEMIARTEIIRAHAEGQLDALENLGVTEVGVQVEWATARDNAVCDECEPMEGVVFDVEEAHGMIPLHPNCRCAFVPSLPDWASGKTKGGKKR